MKKYISQIEALDACYNGWQMDTATIETIVSNIERIPAADVVEIVRCDKCIYHDDDSPYHYCRKWRKNCPDDSDFYCKWGKRKDGDRE